MIYKGDFAHCAASRRCKLRKNCYRYWLEKNRTGKCVWLPYVFESYNREENKCINFIEIENHE